MSEAEAKAEKKQRRIKGDAYWKLNGYLKKTQKMQKDLAEWQHQKAEESTYIHFDTGEPITGVYPDLINWQTGAIFNDGAEIVKGMVRNGKIIGRLAKDVLTEYREKMTEQTDLTEEIDAYRNQLAMALNVWPEQIDWKTGKIDTEEFDGIELPENPAEADD